MKEIDERATAVLLASLSNEINIKCMELKERHNDARLKKIFFTGCIFIFFSFFVQIFFKIFNVNFLFGFIIYQGLALAVLVPVVAGLNRRRVLK